MPGPWPTQAQQALIFAAVARRAVLELTDRPAGGHHHPEDVANAVDAAVTGAAMALTEMRKLGMRIVDTPEPKRHTPGFPLVG